MGVCFVCMSVHICMQCPYRRGQQIFCNWSYKWFLHCPGHWELNAGPLQEQQMLLTAEPFWQPLSLVSLKEGSAVPGEKKDEFPLTFVNFLL